MKEALQGTRRLLPMKRYLFLGVACMAGVAALVIDHLRAQTTTDPARKASAFGEKLAAAALVRTKAKVRYDPAYVVLDYPGGDVPANTGVCTDVVIRSYRKLGLDLQKLVHEDMRKNFSKYPKNWGAKRPDKNIDHRRVPNLQKYLSRFGKVLPKSKKRRDYLPGDLVAWDLNNRGLWHIGIVVEKPGKPGSRWIVHNIGSGPRLEDCLFDWKIIGHYRFEPRTARKTK